MSRYHGSEAVAVPFFSSFGLWIFLGRNFFGLGGRRKEMCRLSNGFGVWEGVGLGTASGDELWSAVLVCGKVWYTAT